MAESFHCSPETTTTFVMGCEKAMAPHCSTPAWKIPWTEEPGGLPSMRSHRVGHDLSDLAAAAAAAYETVQNRKRVFLELNPLF